MDGRVLNVTEDLVRKMFHLNPAYEVSKFNINEKTASIDLDNGLIPISIKIPRNIIDGVLEQEVSIADVMAKAGRVQEEAPPRKEAEPVEDSVEPDLVKTESILEKPKVMRKIRKKK